MPKLIDEEGERLAVHLADLDLFDNVMRCKLFGPGLCRLDVEGREEAKGNPILVFKGGLVQSALIIDLGRSYNREAGQKVLRVYLDKGNGWQRVPSKTALTILVEGSTALNPEVFDNDLKAPALQAESIL